MELHQIQVFYNPAEDRLLCRAAFKDGDGELQEVRAWFTRRLVRQLWPVTLQALERQVAMQKPEAAHASADIVGMEYQNSVDTIRGNGNFDQPYQAKDANFPLGKTPILVHQVDFKIHADQPIRMKLSPETGAGFEIAFTQTILHGFCELLKNAVNQAEWGIELQMPGLEPPAKRVMN